MGAMFPALSIKPPESPLQQLGQAQQIIGQRQQLETGAVQLEQAKLAQRSQQTLMALMAKNNGDMNATYNDAVNSGTVLPDHLIDFRNKSLAAQTQAATLTKEQLDNHAKIADMPANELDSMKGLAAQIGSDPAQRQKLFTAMNGAMSRLVQVGGPDTMQWLEPIAADLLANPSPENFARNETLLKGSKWLNENAQEALKLASMPTAAQAQAKTAAELDKAQTDALMAHQQLLNLSTLEEAKTKRMADLRETVAKTLQANADTAEKTAQTALIGAQPVFAYDPQTLQRVLTTMPQVGAKGLTNPVKASEGDINKETELTRQFNDVQMNVSRYRNAVNSIAHNLSSDSASNISGILSNEKVGGLLDKLPGGAITADQLKQTVTARAWNALTSDEQDAVTGYLRAKGSIIAFQKALTQTGRTSKEALEIEMQNLPSPLVGSTVANKQLDAFQENIDTASKGIVRVPWLPTTQDVRKSIEGVNVSTGKTTGQFERPRSPISTGGAGGVQIGQVINHGGAAMRVTKVYPDGSYDAEPR